MIAESQKILINNISESLYSLKHEESLESEHILNLVDEDVDMMDLEEKDSKSMKQSLLNILSIIKKY